MATLQEKLEEKNKNCKTKLPPEFKKKLLKALRGGEYHFVKGTLCRPLAESEMAKGCQDQEYGYCTLGVAAHLSGYSPEEIKGMGGIPMNYERVPLVLRNTMVERDEHGAPIQSVPDAIVTRNDADLATGFDAAADWIEEKL